MVREIDLIRYLPQYLSEYKELQHIANAENPEFCLAWNRSEQVLDNMFIMSADETGIRRFERILKIFPATEDSLETRRFRVLSVWNDRLPYTLRALKTKLGTLINDFNLWVDYGKYTLHFETGFENMVNYREILDVINRMLPANMVLVVNPVLYSTIELSEDILTSSMRHNYKLGSWELGKLPFISFGEEEYITMALPPVKSSLLIEIARYIGYLPAEVAINRSHYIYPVDLSGVEYDEDKNIATATLQYTIPQNIGVGQVETIQLTSKMGDFAEKEVKIPLLTDLVMKHKIIVREVE